MSTEKTRLRLSMDDLTLGDMELFEEATGRDIMDVLKPRPVLDEVTGRPVPDPNDDKGRPLLQAQVTSKAFVGLVFLALRKDNPNLTIEEVKAMRISDIDFDIDQGPDAEADPTDESADELSVAS